MTILGIETSCDETACSIIDLEGNILSNVVASQIETHAPYGGIIPELASRAHIVNIHKVVEEAIQVAKVSINELSAIGMNYPYYIVNKNRTFVEPLNCIDNV